MTNNNWISVHDKLPRPYDSVIIYHNDTSSVGFLGISGWIDNLSHDYGIDITTTVTHWMPLPGAPDLEPELKTYRVYSIESVYYMATLKADSEEEAAYLIENGSVDHGEAIETEDFEITGVEEVEE